MTAKYQTKPSDSRLHEAQMLGRRLVEKIVVGPLDRRRAASDGGVDPLVVVVGRDV